jgi:hypothetical protein
VALYHATKIQKISPVMIVTILATKSWQVDTSFSVNFHAVVTTDNLNSAAGNSGSDGEGVEVA